MTRPYRAISIDDLVKRYEVGETVEEIAASVGLKDGSHLRFRMRRAGYHLRSGSEAARLRYLREPSLGARISEKAHAAVRGVKRTDQDLYRRALTREGRMSKNVSPSAILLAVWLTERGCVPMIEKAVGPYNVDIAIGNVAVEVFGGNWHGSRDHRQRFRYLGDRGWNVVVVWVQPVRHPLNQASADYIVAFAQSTEGPPPIAGEYRVIRGAAEFVSGGRLDDDDLTLVPPRKRRSRVRRND